MIIVSGSAWVLLTLKGLASCCLSTPEKFIKVIGAGDRWKFVQLLECFGPA